MSYLRRSGTQGPLLHLFPGKTELRKQRQVMPLLGYGVLSSVQSGLALKAPRPEPGCHGFSGSNLRTSDNICGLPSSSYGVQPSPKVKKPRRRPPKRIREQQKLQLRAPVPNLSSPLAFPPPATLPANPLLPPVPVIQPLADLTLLATVAEVVQKQDERRSIVAAPEISAVPR